MAQHRRHWLFVVIDYLKKSQKDPAEQSWNPEQQSAGLTEARTHSIAVLSAEIFI